VLSGGASRHASVTGPFDRVSSNSVEQTFTAVVEVFIGAHLENAVETTDAHGLSIQYNLLVIHLADERV